ncbi:MAG TPA: hypothetical protein VLM11_21575 [Streptosporangiaceae bacterium]|nr:hypothetical protein [Streptosporangiaceae bacterium]
MSNTRGQPTVGQEYGAGAYQQPAGYGEPRYAEPAPSGGVVAGTVLAGVLMMLGGAWDFLAGLAVSIRHGFFAPVSNTYAYHWDVQSWGWTQLAIGAVIFAAGVCVLLGMTWARVVGVILASFSAIAAFMFLPYYPVWAIIIVAIDVYIIWALVSVGRRRRARI